MVLINALAGCAKTSTLKMIAEQNPESRFLYLAFNRKIVDEAVETFPLNTKASTLHALARAYTGRKSLKYLNMDMIKEILNSDIANSSDYFKVFNALKAYQNFCQSAFSIDELDELKRDTRKKMKEDFTKRIKNKNMDFLINQRVNAIDLVEEIHDTILNSDFTTFDTFLKEFVESADDRTFNYDYIVLDESQDVSKLLAKFIISLAKSKRYKIIIVGDNNQKIYGFLGNTNLALVMEQLYPDRVINMGLNRSFRFQKDSDIESLSNQLLALRGETIIGARESVPSCSDNDRVAYLSRSTFPLLAMSIHQILNKKEYHLYGGINNFNIEEIKDIYNLYIYTKELKKLLYDELVGLNIEKQIEKLADKKDEKSFPHIQSNSLKAFSSFTELDNFASSRAIFELQNNISIVYFIYSKKKALEDIEENASYHIIDQFFSLIEIHSNPHSNTIISTIHKSKGLEFESVTILKSLVVYATNDEISSVSSENGNILGLSRTDIDFSRQYRSNQELVEILNSAEKSDGNIFGKKGKKEKIEISLKGRDNKTPKIVNELIINQKMGNIKEEYNILYVAITRAIRDIQIANVNYIETLDFLEFINKNLDEIIKISQGEDSPLVIEIEKKDGQRKKVLERGVVYEDNFISITTLLALLEEL
jgi:superfamily I DNA/RNA helicase